MFDDDLEKLAFRGPDKSLDNIESDVWAGIGNAELAGRSRRMMTTCQLMALVVVLIGSAVFGAAGSGASKGYPFDLARAGSHLAPSTLLLGRDL